MIMSVRLKLVRCLSVSFAGVNVTEEPNQYLFDSLAKSSRLNQRKNEEGTANSILVLILQHLVSTVEDSYLHV